MSRVLLLSTLLAVAFFLIASCVQRSGDSKPPFTLDYTLDDEKADLFIHGDSFSMLFASSPFYSGIQNLPGLQIDGYVTARRKKVSEIIAESETLVKATLKIKPEVEQLRVAYLDYLTACRKEDAKLSNLVKEAVGEIILLKSKEEITEVAYASIYTDSGNAYAKSFMEYVKVSKSVELGALYLQDLNNIMAFAALTLQAQENSGNAKIINANRQLDTKMKRFDRIRDDLKTIIASLEQIDYCFRQIETADHYFALSAVAFMEEQIPELKRQAQALKPGKTLTKADILDINDYLTQLAAFCGALKHDINSADKSRLIQVSANPAPRPNYAWADSGRMTATSYARSTTALKQAPVKSGGVMTALKEGWKAVKSGCRAAQFTIGMTLDGASSMTRSVMNIPVGIYYGNSAKDIYDCMVANYKEVESNYRAGMSGSDTLREAKSYMHGVEDKSSEAASGMVASVMGEGYTSWAAGGIAKATTSIFTGFAKGLYALADPTSTEGELAVGAMEVGFSMVGGSKVVFKAGQLPGMLKGGAEGTKLLAEKGWNLSARWVEGGELAHLKEIYRLMVKYNTPGAHKQFDLAIKATQVAAQEAMMNALRETGKALNTKMANLIKKGAIAFGEGASATMKDSLNVFVRKQFQSNMKGFFEAVKTSLGDSAVKYLDNVVGQMVDDYLKDMVDRAIQGNPFDGYYSGRLSGVNFGGSIKFHINGRGVSGTFSGSHEGEPFTGQFTGTFTPKSESTGDMRCSLGGSLISDGKSYRFVGKIEGKIDDGSAKGTYEAIHSLFEATGPWSAAKGK